MNNPLKFRFLITFFSLFYIILTHTSCGIFNKNHTGTNGDKDSLRAIDKHADVVKPNPEVVSFVEAQKKAALNYETLTMKFSGELINNENSTPLKGIIRIKRDSFVWISIRPGLGIELARAVFQPDTVKLLDRMKSTYFVGNYGVLDSSYSVYADYLMIEAIIANRFFVYKPDKNLKPNYAKFNIRKLTADTELFFIDSLNTDAYNQTFKFTSDYKLINVTAVNTTTQRKVEIKYSDYEPVMTFQLPKRMDIELTEGAKKSKIFLEFSDFKVNEPAKNAFSIPDSYSPMVFKKK